MGSDIACMVEDECAKIITPARLKKHSDMGSKTVEL